MTDATVSRVMIEFEDGSRIESDDFVAVTNNDQCDARLYFSADAITLGQALQLISYAYTDQLAQLPEEDAEKVREALRIFLDVENNNE